MKTKKRSARAAEADAAKWRALHDARFDQGMVLSGLLAEERRRKRLESARLGHVEIVEVIRITYNRGDGVEGSSIRNVVEWWTKDGRCIADEDPCGEARKGAA